MNNDDDSDIALVSDIIEDVTTLLPAGGSDAVELPPADVGKVVMPSLEKSDQELEDVVDEKNVYSELEVYVSEGEETSVDVVIEELANGVIGGEENEESDKDEVDVKVSKLVSVDWLLPAVIVNPETTSPDKLENSAVVATRGADVVSSDIQPGKRKETRPFVKERDGMESSILELVNARPEKCFIDWPFDQQGRVRSLDKDASSVKLETTIIQIR